MNYFVGIGTSAAAPAVVGTIALPHCVARVRGHDACADHAEDDRRGEVVQREALELRLPAYPLRSVDSQYHGYLIGAGQS